MGHIVGDLDRSHRVFLVFNRFQVEHQAIVIEATSMMRGSSVTILFDLGPIDSFISPFLVECCGLVVAR